MSAKNQITLNEQEVELCAQAIYERFDPVFTLDCPWKDGGKSFQQMEARYYARAALSALASAHVTSVMGALKDAIEGECGGLALSDEQAQNILHHLASIYARAAVEVPNGWTFNRNSDGSIGIRGPEPKPGEAQRTSDTVYETTHCGLHELLGRLADHQAAQAAPKVPEYLAVGEIESIDEGNDEDGPSAWVALHRPVKLGENLYAAPSPEAKAQAVPGVQACGWCCGTGRFADHTCRFCNGRAVAPAPQPATSEQHVISAFLERTGQYVTNDASREAAIADAISEQRKPLLKGEIEAEFASICQKIPERRTLIGFDSFVDGVRFAESRCGIRSTGG